MIIENIDQMTDEEVLEQLSMNPTSDTPFMLIPSRFREMMESIRNIIDLIETNEVVSDEYEPVTYSIRRNQYNNEIVAFEIAIPEELLISGENYLKSLVEFTKADNIHIAPDHETSVARLTFAYGGVYQEMEIEGFGND